jgi:branched-chain amino acid transport system substrate-binding protein
LGELMTQKLGELGADVALRLQVAVEQADFSAEVGQIAAASPDAVFYGGYEVEAPYLRAQLVEAGVDVPFLASDGAFLSSTIDEAGVAAEGVYVSAFAPSPDAVVDDAWIRDYQAVEYRNPDTYSINGYSAMAVLVAGAVEADSFDAVQVADAIRGLDGIETPMGTIRYNQNGDRQQQNIYIFQVQDADWVQIYPQP